MEITVVGAGNIGGNIARQLARAGHSIILTFARDVGALQRLAADIGGSTATPADAVAAAEVVVVSVPWDAIPEALRQMGPLTGKVVIDTTNQFGQGAKPGPGQTAAALNADRMPGASYAKSFNTLTAAFQRDTAHRDPRVVQWVCGADKHVAEVTSSLVRDAGYEPVAVGRLEHCAVMEAPRRPGGVYGEEYRLGDALAVIEALRAGRRIPPTPSYG